MRVAGHSHPHIFNDSEKRHPTMKKILTFILPALMLFSCAKSAHKQLEHIARTTDFELRGSTIETGIVCDGCEFKGNEFIYYYTFDEELIPYESLESNKKELYEAYASTLTKEAVGNDFYNLIKEIDGNVTYHFTGNPSARTFIISIKVSN